MKDPGVLPEANRSKLNSWKKKQTMILVCLYITGMLNNVKVIFSLYNRRLVYNKQTLARSWDNLEPEHTFLFFRSFLQCMKYVFVFTCCWMRYRNQFSKTLFIKYFFRLIVFTTWIHIISQQSVNPSIFFCRVKENCI